MTTDYWIIIVVTLLFSAFFSGIEIAFISSNKLKIELDRRRGVLSGKILTRFVQAPSAFIAMVLVGNNIALVIYGIFMAKTLEPALIYYFPSVQNSETVILIIQTTISTFIILLTAEFLPKIIFRNYANRILNFFSVLTFIVYIALYPATFIIIKISQFIVKTILRLDISVHKQVFSLIDIDHYIAEFTQHSAKDSLIKNEVQIFQNARDLPHIKLRECMIPRPEIIATEINDDVTLLRHKFIESGLSKILIYDDNIDNIVGYIHTYDIFRNPVSIKSVLRPILIVPESMTADKLLATFIKQNKSIAVVVDEFGGTSGILTIEDLVEEIFGEIEDEYDMDELTDKKISENEYLFSGRMEIDFINEKYNLNLPTGDDYETLAGLIISHYESIPEKGSRISIPPFEFTTIAVSKTKIEQVNLKINNE